MQNIKKMMQLFAEEPRQLTFAESANEKQLDLREYLESMFRDGERTGRHERMGSEISRTDHGIKRSIACIGACRKFNSRKPRYKSIPSKISLEIFIRACKLLNYFIEHAQKAYGVMAIGGEAEDAKHLFKYLLQSGKSVIHDRRFGKERKVDLNHR